MQPHESSGRHHNRIGHLTYQEWLNDFASPETKAIGEKLIRKEIEEIKAQVPNIYPQFSAMFARIIKGERDLYF